MPYAYNRLHGLAAVTAPDGALLGAVPHSPAGERAANDAVTAYLCAAADIPATVVERLRCARRVIVLAGGTPNIAPIRRSPDEPWETVVIRHQSQLRGARIAHAPAEPAARQVGG